MKKALMIASLLIGAAAPVAAQSGTVEGVVVDARTGDTIPGANVVLEGTTTGASTGVDGTFSLSAPAGTYRLLASFVGYLPASQPVSIEEGQTRRVEVELDEDLLGLDEVFVVGFGTTSELALTGSVARVGERELEDAVVNSFEQVLQGRAAGVTVQANNGKLGQGLQIRVRGSASVSAGNGPLYVVDGIPVTTENLSTNGAATNPLAQLSPSDISSIEVLKDASASAIYGSRGSNGVVLITTKSGFDGRTQFTVDVRGSASQATRQVELLNAQEYTALLLEAAENSARLDPSYDYVGDVEGQFDFLSQGTDWRTAEVNSDWQDQAFQTGGGYQVDVSARGGSQNTQFFLSGSYSQEDGILIRDEYDRITGRLNLNHEVSDALSLGANLGLSRVLNNRISTDNSFATPVQIIAQPPISPITMSEGDLNENTLYFNTLLYNDNTRFAVTGYRNLGNVFGDLQIVPSLRFRSEFGVDVLDQNSDEYYNSRVAENTGAPQGLAVDTWDRVVNYTTNNYLTFEREVGADHGIEATTGITYQDVSLRNTSVTGERFPNDDFQQVDGAAQITAGTATETRYRFLGYFGRANYDFKDRYFLSASGRVDGSSRFGSENRYGFFPAVSGAWVLSDEPFFSGVPGVSFLKLRASYGITGNADISTGNIATNNFASLGLWSVASYGGTPGIIPIQVENPDLKWERTSQIDAGLDFAFFNNRVSGELDVYAKNTDDLLLFVNVPALTGYSAVLRNVGTLQNRGVELAFNARLVNTRRFSWTSTFNISANRNEITDLDGQVIEGGFINRAIEGEPIGVFFGYEYAGVDPDNGDALYFVNEGADPRATTNDPNEATRVVLGSPHPDFTGGLGNTVTAGGVELQMFWQFVSGNQIYDGGGRFKTANGDYYDNQLRDQLDRWQQPGDVTDVPEARLYFGNGTAESSRYLYDGSYVRLKTLSVAYNVPVRLLRNFSVQGARVYLVGTNLLTLTEYPWWDPEVNADYVAGNIGLGNEFYSAPQARSVSLGLQFTF
ncbi:SusC/RagA family TonB-linked outer membrane protein [Rubrivirga litoralis]|uniref:TonB-dependent receptor n=1 Tax=Rubrivirga litoralis TaxID=3075598 RepID=A0ABU3BNL4_9BACT|nr:TonB-dependent receptor [Rubrivirga sp. F394]MDT0630865.1 TonB-dependent receptor [Rubrivirga sp. F394]